MITTAGGQRSDLADTHQCHPAQHSLVSSPLPLFFNLFASPSLYCSSRFLPLVWCLQKLLIIISVHYSVPCALPPAFASFRASGELLCRPALLCSLGLLTTLRHRRSVNASGSTSLCIFLLSNRRGMGREEKGHSGKRKDPITM